MASAAASLTHSGTSKSSCDPKVTSASTMTPIVFWASCRPCPNAIAAADAICALRKPRVVRCGLRFRKPHRIASISR